MGLVLQGKQKQVKIQYWAAANIGGNIINFSVTGEGSIDVECEADAKIKAAEINPIAKKIQLQQVAIVDYPQLNIDGIASDSI